MGLSLPKPPTKGPDIIRTALGSLIDHTSSVAADMAIGGTESLDLSAPHRMYFVGLEDVTNNSILSNAKLIGWRYIILKGDDPMAAAELGVDDSGGGLEFSQINRGPFVGSTVEGVGLAENLDAVRNDTYEPRLLKIPSLYIIALWLHGENSEDIIIPLPPTRPELKAYDSYNEEEFTKAIQGAATRRLEFQEEEPQEA